MDDESRLGGHGHLDEPCATCRPGRNVRPWRSTFTAAQGESPKTDQNFGALPAFSTVLGSASYGYTFSVTVLKKSTEIAVDGVTTKLSNVEGLAKKLVAIN
jgi:hypothetical protein